MTQQTPQPTGHASECAQFEAQLMAYLEHDLDALAHDWMYRHQVVCVACSSMVREVEGLVRSAAALPVLAPTHDLWTGIASRLDASVVPLHSAASAGSMPSSVASLMSRGNGMRVRHLAIAATVLVAVSSSVTWRLAQWRVDGAAITASRDDGAANVAAIVPVVNADVTYEREIAALRAIVTERFTELDSTTVAELQRNLAIIDAAIADSRTALEKDPNSRLLAGTLDRALATKLALMRRVALL